MAQRLAVSPALLAKLDELYPDTLMRLTGCDTAEAVALRAAQMIGARQVVNFLKSLNETSDDGDEQDD